MKVNYARQSINKNYIIQGPKQTKPIAVAAQSKSWVCDLPLAGIVGSNPPGVWMFVSCEYCVLSDRVLYVGLITRPEESYRVRCVWV
jgi:hypothetical protein